MEFEDRYFEWLVEKINNNGIADNYYHLLDFLFNKDFVWVNEYDANRVVDAEKLREDYGWDGHFSGCSCLEMLIALAERCQHHIMGDPGGPDQTYKWFWSMIENLGLDRFDDDHFVYDLVDDIVMDWMELRYSADGKGGLFPLKHPHKDMREVEIWFQMCAWLNENYEM